MFLWREQFNYGTITHKKVNTETHIGKYAYLIPRNRDKFCFKMEAKEDPELTSSHKHAESIATLEINLTTSGATSPT